MESRHNTVLMEEAVESLELKTSDTAVDMTLGGAGHFKSMLCSLGSEGTLIGIDADEDAIARAGAVVEEDKRSDKPAVMLVQDNFRNLSGILDREGIEAVDKVLFDLGWSGFQLERGRGFSFQTDEPLYMTYGDPEEATTAADIVNSSSEEALVEILFTFGEERFARGIAKAIVKERKRGKILTTAALVSVVESGTPAWYHHRRLHPATKTFQALRIAVNDELGALREGLASALDRVPAGGRIAVITFHSIEDRIVKGMFRDAAYAGKGFLHTRKPITPSDRELADNPRARSAKLRVFVAGEPSEPRTGIFNTHHAYA